MDVLFLGFHCLKCIFMFRFDAYALLRCADLCTDCTACVCVGIAQNILQDIPMIGIQVYLAYVYVCFCNSLVVSYIMYLIIACITCC